MLSIYWLIAVAAIASFVFTIVGIFKIEEDVLPVIGVGFLNLFLSIFFVAIIESRITPYCSPLTLIITVLLYAIIILVSCKAESVLIFMVAAIFIILLTGGLQGRVAEKFYFTESNIERSVDSIELLPVDKEGHYGTLLDNGKVVAILTETGKQEYVLLEDIQYGDKAAIEIHRDTREGTFVFIGSTEEETIYMLPQNSIVMSNGVTVVEKLPNK